MHLPLPQHKNNTKTQTRQDQDERWRKKQKTKKQKKTTRQNNKNTSQPAFTNASLRDNGRCNSYAPRKPTQRNHNNPPIARNRTHALMRLPQDLLKMAKFLVKINKLEQAYSCKGHGFRPARSRTEQSYGRNGFTVARYTRPPRAAPWRDDVEPQTSLSTPAQSSQSSAAEVGGWHRNAQHAPWTVQARLIVVVPDKKSTQRLDQRLIKAHPSTTTTTQLHTLMLKSSTFHCNKTK